MKPFDFGSYVLLLFFALNGFAINLKDIDLIYFFDLSF